MPGIGKLPVIGLSDLVKAKKTQRDKDWPMIRRLIEADIYKAPDDPAEDKICFWFTECRTPESLILLAQKYPEIGPSVDPYEIRTEFIRLLSSRATKNLNQCDKLFYLANISKVLKPSWLNLSTLFACSSSRLGFLIRTFMIIKLNNGL